MFMLRIHIGLKGTLANSLRVSNIVYSKVSEAWRFQIFAHSYIGENMAETL